MWETLIPAVAGLASNALGGLFGSFGASDQEDAQEDALREQRRMWLEARQDLAPWRRRGRQATTQLWQKIQAGPGEYEKSPYYDWLQQEGTKALERGAAARGSQFSGAEQKALTQYGQNLASTDYDNWLNRWYKSLTPYQNLSEMGLRAAGASSGQSAQYANMIGNTMSGLGETRAAGQLNWGNTAQQGMNSLADILYRVLGNQNSASGVVPNDYNQNFYNYYNRGGL